MRTNSLQKYKEKRNFKITDEPFPKKIKSKKTLSFVIQEHHSKHLHWDFRLEWDGVLKSWAIPKGPSDDSKVKRLAVQVEDHPISYGNFQGTIPHGQYGAGDVLIWDKGTWEPDFDPDEGLKKGKIEFILKGKKLRGHWVLIRTHYNETKNKKNWLLIKLKDHITSPDKIIYKKERITKEDIATFYKKISQSILPYIENRPLSLVRCPEGTEKICFYQRHIQGRGTYITINSKDGLEQLVQMNAFELHEWNCHLEDIKHPDQIVMDFDPGLGVPWKEVVKASLELKKILKQLKLKSFVKLTGGKGLHVHIPHSPIYSWDQVKGFAQALAQEMVDRNPEKYTANMSKKLRKGKIFVDYLRNGYGATAVVPYSLRAKPISAVAMPVDWKELSKIKSSDQFSLEKALRKLKTRKLDPWKGMNQLKQKITLLESHPK